MRNFQCHFGTTLKAFNAKTIDFHDIIAETYDIGYNIMAETYNIRYDILAETYDIRYDMWPVVATYDIMAR